MSIFNKQIAPHQWQKGFTLIELMITVVIISILSAIAYPGYQSYTRKANRTDGKAALAAAAANQEDYFSRNMGYAANMDVLGYGPGVIYSPQSKYTISTSSATTDVYTLTATSVLPDPDCGTMTLTNTGLRSPSTGCW